MIYASSSKMPGRHSTRNAGETSAARTTPMPTQIKPNLSMRASVTRWLT
jgi:hypothetical protein